MSDQEMRKEFENIEYLPPTSEKAEDALNAEVADLVTDENSFEADKTSESYSGPIPQQDSVFATQDQDFFRAPENPIPETQMTPQMQSLAEERAALKAARAEVLSPNQVANMAEHNQRIDANRAWESTSVLPVEKPAENNENAKPELDKNLGKKPNDRFLPSLGLFILRWVTAFIVGVNGVNIVTGIPQASEFMNRLGLPEPEIIAWIFGVALLGIAVCLVFGLLTRIAGLLLAVASGLTLAFYYWGPWSIFIDGQPGFLGERELLLGVVGLLFCTIGAGGWSLDRSFRVGRARDKAERALANADF